MLLLARTAVRSGAFVSLRSSAVAFPNPRSRSLSSSLTDSDALENLGTQMKSVAKMNKDILNNIKEKNNETVITGFNYSLSTNRNDKNELYAEMHAEPGKASVENRLRAWRYEGAPLKATEDVFNDKIDYDMNTYKDVVRLNTELVKVGSKYCDLLADKPKTRAGLRIFVDNLLILQGAIADLDKLTVDAEDTLTKNNEVNSAMKGIFSEFEKLLAQLPGAALKVSYSKDTRIEEDYHHRHNRYG